MCHRSHLPKQCRSPGRASAGRTPATTVRKHVTMRQASVSRSNSESVPMAVSVPRERCAVPLMMECRRFAARNQFRTFVASRTTTEVPILGAGAPLSSVSKDVRSTASAAKASQPLACVTAHLQDPDAAQRIQRVQTRATVAIAAVASASFSRAPIREGAPDHPLIKGPSVLSGPICSMDVDAGIFCMSDTCLRLQGETRILQQRTSQRPSAGDQGRRRRMERRVTASIAT